MSKRLGLSFVVALAFTGIAACNPTQPNEPATTTEVETPSPSPVESTPVSSPSPITVSVSEIARKTPKEIEEILGEPTRIETVTPSNTPCPCPKHFYIDEAVEVVFIDDKADWITLNLPVSKIDVSGSYLSVDQFEDYTYVKVSTQ